MTRRILMSIASVIMFCGATGSHAASLTPLQQEGKRVFHVAACDECHGAGLGQPGTEALAAQHDAGQSPLLAKRTDLSDETVKFFVRHGIANMPAVRKTEVSDRELAALAAYLSRNYAQRASDHK